MSSSSGAAEPTASLPRYAEALRSELTAIDPAAHCALEAEQRYHCGFKAPGARPTPMHAVYSDQTDTVYVYLERYALVPPDDAQRATKLQRMMELNWELLVGKLEWSPRTGEVRLSAVLNTDSNFDRRALRSIVLALEAVAARYRAELGSGT